MNPNPSPPHNGIDPRPTELEQSDDMLKTQEHDIKDNEISRARVSKKLTHLGAWRENLETRGALTAVWMDLAARCRAIILALPRLRLSQKFRAPKTMSPRSVSTTSVSEHERFRHWRAKNCNSFRSHATRRRDSIGGSKER